ncbi:hypothetical protein KP509_33G034300 [Ceratopteris richardii]|uniref:Uncharacterized protein n=1 Tax=Ceratopteris richardii TaxID=49495 RepID=A0A8T2QNM8_CERRI|nr:hypothetical protein KP509_33G034300 [Ceratopteris richardii]
MSNIRGMMQLSQIHDDRVHQLAKIADGIASITIGRIVIINLHRIHLEWLEHVAGKWEDSIAATGHKKMILQKMTLQVIKEGYLSSS